MTTQLNPKRTLKDDVRNFIFDWHEFPFDYWWRKKYNVPFGSQAHREMNFIDMYIEYQEEHLLQELREEYERKEDEAENRSLGLTSSGKEIVHLTKEEIDDDYDNLDLSQFDNK